jgi:nucleoside-diphosphate-sugar epimerase
MVSYAGRRILVTGGTGFIGGRLAERLVIEEHANVRVLVRDWRKAVWVSRLNVELVHGDIRDAEVVARAMQDCDIVFHCVGIGGSLEHCMSVNLDGTRNVLECASNTGIRRLVYLSTCGVHGPEPPNNADEQQSFNSGGDAYNSSKIAAEQIVQQYWRERQLPVVIIRPFPVWGPRAPSFTLWPVKQINSGRWFLINGGVGTCQAVYVENLVDSILLAGLHPNAVGEAFLIDDDQTCTWAEFFNRYAAMLNRQLPSIRLGSARAALQATQQIDKILTKFQELPSYEPAHSLLRVVRKGISVLRRVPAHYAVFSRGELIKYSHTGKVNTSKSRNILNYRSRYSLEQGMRETETWLRDQRLIATE